MSLPRTAEAFLSFEDHEARAWTLLGQVISTSNPGDPRPDDNDIEMFRFADCALTRRRCPLSGFRVSGLRVHNLTSARPSPLGEFAKSIEMRLLFSLRQSNRHRLISLRCMTLCDEVGAFVVPSRRSID